MRRILGLLTAAALVLAGGFAAAPVRADTWPFPNLTDLPVIAEEINAGTAASSYAVSVANDGTQLGLEEFEETDGTNLLAVMGVDVVGPAGVPILSSAAWTQSGAPVLYVANGNDVLVDQRVEPAAGGLGFGIGLGFSVDAGTYTVTFWSASETPIVRSGFRVDGGDGVTIAGASHSSDTFVRSYRDMTGGTTVKADVGVAGVQALIGQSASVAIESTLHGAFLQGNSLLPNVLADDTYDGPDGTHSLGFFESFSGAPAGAYVFHITEVNAGVFVSPPFVAGADIAPPAS